MKPSIARHARRFMLLCALSLGALAVTADTSARKQTAQTAGAQANVVAPATVWQQAYGPSPAPGITGMAYAPDGQTVTTAHGDRAANVWRASDGALLHSFTQPGYSCSGGATSLAYSPDSQLIAVADACAVRLLTIADGTRRTFAAAGRIAFSPDGHYLAATIQNSYNTRTVKLFRVADGALVWSATGGGNQIAFSPTGALATVNTRDGIEFWDVADGTRQRVIAGVTTALAFSPDGQLVAGAGGAGGEYPYDATISIFHTGDGSLARKITRTGGVWTQRFTPDGQYLVSGGQDTNYERVSGYVASTNTIRVWRLADGLAFKTYDLGVDSPGFGGLAVSPDSQSLAYAVGATTYLASMPAPAQCAYAITPTSATFARGGGAGTIMIDTQPGCAWTARARVSWLSVVTASGTGPGTATYNVAPDTEPISADNPYFIHGVLVVAEQTLAVHQDIAPAGPGHFRVYGTVSDGSCHTGVAGITVTLGGAASATATTDADGIYSFDDVTGAQNYTVTPSKDGYTFSPASVTITNLASDYTAYFSTVNNPRPLPSVRGRIASVTGSGLEGVRLDLTGGAYPRTDYTFANGNYAFNCLDPGYTYTLTPASDQYDFTPPSRVFPGLTTAQQGADLLATPKVHTASLAGRVTDPQGSGLSGVTVNLGGAATDTRTTDSSGGYSFTGLATGRSYTVSAALDGYTFMPAAQTVGDMTNDAKVDFAGASGARGQLIISEFRTRGPGGAQDEYVELYNNTDQPITVATDDGSAGWTLATLSADGGAPAPVHTIPAGATIPARGHYLVGNRGGADAAGALVPASDFDATYTTDIGDDRGLALFRTAAPEHLTLAYRADAVEFAAQTTTGNAAPLFAEGAGIAPVSQSVAADEQYAYVRRLTSGTPQDTGDNARDFVVVSTTGTVGGQPVQFGAPSPENSQSPVQQSARIKASLVDHMAAPSDAPNRVRDLTPVANGALGTLTFRRRFTNRTGLPVTALRFRIVDLTTLNTPNTSGGAQADLRALDSANTQVTTTGGGTLLVRGTLLEQPPSQSLGGGMNSALAVELPGGALAPLASIDVQFALGVQAGGSFRFLITVEAATGGTVTGGKVTTKSPNGTTKFK